jgi:hypothetical protein
VVAIAVNKMNFTNSVFINCPFDNEYLPLLKPLLFILIKLGFNPRIALERSDSGEIRLNKILELIESSKFSIHDLSRLIPICFHQYNIFQKTNVFSHYETPILRRRSAQVS